MGACRSVSRQNFCRWSSTAGRGVAGRSSTPSSESSYGHAIGRATRIVTCCGISGAGPAHHLFGKDRITTLERDLVADPATHVETKNPYFRFIHEPTFCERVL